jgi:hypothetical protein
MCKGSIEYLGWTVDDPLLDIYTFYVTKKDCISKRRNIRWS